MTILRIALGRVRAARKDTSPMFLESVRPEALTLALSLKGEGTGKRTIRRLFCAHFLALALFSPASAAPRQPAPAPAKESVYVPPDAERVVLSNGVVVYLYEDHELPLIDMAIRFRASPADEVPAHAFQLMGDVWRAGGTRALKPDELDERLESSAIEIGTASDNESLSVSLSCLSRDLETGLDVWNDVIRTPTFDAKKLAIAKGQALEALRRKNETPNQVGRRAFRDVIYGPEHVYADDPLAEDVNRISRNDLLAIHRRVVAPQTAIIAAAGDFDSKAFIASLERRFADWPKNARVDPAYDYGVKVSTPGRVFLVEKDFSQSRVSVGRLGIDRHASDRFACAIADYILGGSGPSRLFAEIRSRRGLAYMVGSFLQLPTGPGMIGVVSQTKAGATVAVIDAILKEMEKFSTTEVSAEELDLAKSALVNSDVFNYDRPIEIAGAHAMREFYGYEPDELKKKPFRFLAVTRADVMAVAKKYYRPEDAKILVVGDPKKFDGSLEKFGNVIKIPLESIR